MISVAIQGGAMRSIYCLGVVRALTESPHCDEVGSIHAASAGCVSGMVLASKLTSANSASVADMGEEMVTRLAGPRFIDQHRLRKMVDVDYLVAVTKKVTSVGVAQLMTKGLTFEVALTDAENACARYLDLANAASDEDLYDALRGTMAIPVLYPPHVVLGGHRYVDGGIADPLPVMKALTLRPDAVIAISSVATGTLGTEAVGREARILRYAPGISPLVRSLMLTRNPLAEMVDKLLDLQSFCGVQIVRVSPSDPSLLGHRLETDKAKLMALEGLGYEDGLKAFEQLGEARSDS
jgi:predicted patatin/cPLA2 family phospholipase